MTTGWHPAPVSGRIPHRDMEILSYVLDGALEHRDSMGHGSVIRPGEIQHMRAGTGVVHSEFNHSSTETTHFLQIWIIPGERGLTPSYSQYAFDREKAGQAFVLLASRDGRDGSLTLTQDVDLWVTRLSKGQTRSFTVRPGHSAWLHVARGAVAINGHALAEGDGASTDGDERLSLSNGDDAEVLLFDIG